MRMALALLCIGAVTFLLRVLVALVREAMNKPDVMRGNLARFSPSRRGAELILIIPRLNSTILLPGPASVSHSWF